MAIVIAAQLLCQPTEVLADGGTLRTSQRIGSLQVTVFTTPAELRVGPVDISVLVQDAESGHLRETIPVKIGMDQIAANGKIVLHLPEENASSEMATNKLFRAAAFEIPRAGVWRATISIGETGAEFNDSKALRDRSDRPAVIESAATTTSFDFEVAPPLPAWIELAPWLAIPFVVVALFFVHQYFVSIAAKRLTVSHRR
ncbi:MAG TPA: hypothetical protein VGJ15_07330 [Pirellulales bacterium]|jgi:hypothetical protein